jgi:hypothetical protein
VPPDSVIKDFNIFEDILSGLGSGTVFFEINHFCFEGMEKGFHNGVIIAITFRIHTL